MILHIDTTQREELLVQLQTKGGNVIAEDRTHQGFNHAQNLLPAIDRLLQNNGSKLPEITALSVNLGPGSFTGTRVGVAVANALSFALGVPVNNLPAGQARPLYDREPNISQPKAGK